MRGKEGPGSGAAKSAGFAQLGRCYETRELLPKHLMTQCATLRGVTATGGRKPLLQYPRTFTDKLRAQDNEAGLLGSLAPRWAELLGSEGQEALLGSP